MDLSLSAIYIIPLRKGLIVRELKFHFLIENCNEREIIIKSNKIIFSNLFPKNEYHFSMKI